MKSGIGFASPCTRSEEFTLDELGIDAEDWAEWGQDDRDEAIEEAYRSWMWDRIDGGWEAV
jgi:hypothetical protein